MKTTFDICIGRKTVRQEFKELFIMFRIDSHNKLFVVSKDLKRVAVVKVLGKADEE